MNRILFTQEEIQSFFIPSNTTAILKTKSFCSNTPISLRIPHYDFRIQHIKNILQIYPTKENNHNKNIAPLHAGIIDASMGTLFILKKEYEYIYAKYVPHHCTVISNKKHITMIIAHPRPPVFTRMIRDLSTLGVHHIIIYCAVLSEKSYMNSSAWNVLLKTLISGAMQAQTLNVIPKISKHTTLYDALEKLKTIYTTAHASHLLKAVFSQNATTWFTSTIQPLCVDKHNQHSSLVACIGPERGFTSNEEMLLQHNKFVPYKLCNSILRCENAALLAAGTYLSNK